MKYDVVIGLEIHLELKTKTKMFSNAPVGFAQEANTACNEVDIALPGTLPTVNKEAVKKAIQACTALHLNIDPLVKFDRKNYYYSDLPKGFQITQQFHPIGSNGYIDLNVDGEEKRIRINRIHMEEDTAKQYHLQNETLIDFNRAGTPLVEIVSEPDMSSGKDARVYLETLRQILVYLDVSDAKMEEGSMRCDVNISLKPKGSSVLGTKVEIKNLNSISNVEKAIEYEIKRQQEAIENNEPIIQSTRRFDEATKTTILMRKKEGAVDYKYFPEPNIFPIHLDPTWIKDIQNHLPELPQARYERYVKDYGLNDYDAGILIENRELGNYFEKVCEHTKAIKQACNWLIGELQANLTKASCSIENSPISPIHLAQLVDLIENKTISGKQGKQVLELMMDGSDPLSIVEAKGMKQLSDSSAILDLVNEVLDANPQSIIDFKNGKDRAVGFLVGQVMKKSKGQANPAMTSQMVKEALEKR